MGPYGQSVREELGMGGMEAPQSQVDPAAGSVPSVLALHTWEFAYLSYHSHQWRNGLASDPLGDHK